MAGERKKVKAECGLSLGFVQKKLLWTQQKQGQWAGGCRNARPWIAEQKGIKEGT